MASNPPPPRRELVALVLAASFFPGAGCDLFATRTPDVSEGTTSLWQPPMTPQIIVQNLESALEAGNFNDYRRALTEDFVFRPDESDVFAIEVDRPGEGIFENWDREVEASTAEIIRGSASSLVLTLTLFDEVLGVEGRLLKYNYVLTLVASGATTTFKGEAWFTVRLVATGEWFISDWEDVASSSTSDSWGLLKGRSRL